jgi:hypothetical protein
MLSIHKRIYPCAIRGARDVPILSGGRGNGALAAIWLSTRASPDHAARRQPDASSSRTVARGNPHAACKPIGRTAGDLPLLNGETCCPLTTDSDGVAVRGEPFDSTASRSTSTPFGVSGCGNRCSYQAARPLAAELSFMPSSLVRLIERLSLLCGQDATRVLPGGAPHAELLGLLRQKHLSRLPMISSSSAEWGCPAKPLLGASELLPLIGNTHRHRRPLPVPRLPPPWPVLREPRRRCPRRRTR